MYQSALFKFAYFPNYKESIKFLANDLADKEEWDFSDSTIKSFSILKNYLDYTFNKIKSENKITYTNQNEYCCFNTGLVTNNLEEIYSLFEKYKVPKPGFDSQYFFRAFLKKSDTQLLSHFSQNLPDIANYFDQPDLLIFNPQCDLIPDIDHIIQDNISRFPQHLQNTDDPDRRRQLSGSIDEAKKKVKTNYKIAVPQYYNGKIQLLLPLCFTSGSPNPDLALVVHKLNDKTYTAKTCLTLKMAYQNARLIVKPQSNWLRP